MSETLNAEISYKDTSATRTRKDNLKRHLGQFHLAMDTRKSGQTAATAEVQGTFLLHQKHRTLASGVKQRGYRFKTT